MNPTQEQLNARLNPTPVNLNIPNEGSVFRSEYSLSDSVYMMKDGKLQQASISDLGMNYFRRDLSKLGLNPGQEFSKYKDNQGNLSPQYQALLDAGFGEAINLNNSTQTFTIRDGGRFTMDLGKKELQEQFGVDWNSIPTRPEGQMADLSGLIASGKLQGGGNLDFNQVKSALTGAPAKDKVITINNTPNTLATPQQIEEQKKNPLWNSANISQQGSAITTPNGVDYSPLKQGESLDAFYKRIGVNTTAISNPITPPQSGGSTPAPTLPVPQAGNAADTYTQSLTQQIEKQKVQIQQEADKRATEYQTKIDKLQKEIDDYQTLQDEGLADMNDTVAQETIDKKAALELEKQRFDENYNANQALIGELDGLLTTGNQVIEQMKNTTGLASIMNPRIAKTMSDVQARSGVIQAVLSARNGQMTYAQQQLGTTFDALSSIATDQINYYKTVISFYDAQEQEGRDDIMTLTKDQKGFLDAKLNLLTNDLDRLQQTADIVSKAMLDPDTAGAYASAGVSLNDSPQQIGQKLAKYAYSKELADTSNKMATSGYTSTPIAGVQPTIVTDSMGNQKSWYKKSDDFSAPYMLGGDYVQKNNKTGEIRTVVNVPVGTDGGIANSSTTVQTYSSTMQSAINEGATPGEAVLAAMAIAKQTGQNITSNDQTALLAEANRIQKVKNTPAPASPQTTAPVAPKPFTPQSSLIGESIKDTASGISNFFKGLF